MIGVFVAWRVLVVDTFGIAHAVTGWLPWMVADAEVRARGPRAFLERTGRP